MKKSEKKSAPKFQKTTKSEKTKSSSKPKEVTIAHKEKSLESKDSEVPMYFQLHLFDVKDTLVANKDLGIITKSEAVKLMDDFITKKDTAVSGKLIPRK